jgi:DNA-directed RNA polymerase subunit RPC12/RpoP
VNGAFERFLRCGVLAHGFARFQCATCKHDHLVPLSCKTRGLCPSCGGRRMMTLTRHILDATLPHVPMRQWVLSLPHGLRYRVAYDQPLCTAIQRILAGALRRRGLRDVSEEESGDALGLSIRQLLHRLHWMPCAPAGLASAWRVLGPAAAVSDNGLCGGSRRW